jgi:hypothetical protein
MSKICDWDNDGCFGELSGMRRVVLEKQKGFIEERRVVASELHTMNSEPEKLCKRGQTDDRLVFPVPL